MNTNSELERIVGGWLEDRVVEPRHGALRAALERAEQTPQQRHRWLSWWFGPDIERRSHLMISSIAAVASLAMLASAAMLVLPDRAGEPAPVTGAEGATHLVAADGSGEHLTINEALAAAGEGDSILIAPGTYEEALVIETNITLAGTGTRPRETVIIVPADAPEPLADVQPLHASIPGIEAPARPSVGVQLLDTDAVLRNLQIEGRDEGVAVLVRGGAPLFEDVIIRHAGERDTNRVLAGSVFIDGASEPTFQGGQLWHRMQVDEASQVAMEETLLQWAKLVVQGGAHIDIEDGSSFGADNQPITVVEEGTATIVRTRFMEGGVDVLGGTDGAGSVRISETQFASAPGNAVRVEGGASATLWDNDFTGNHRAVTVIGSAAEVRDSTFLDNQTAMRISGSGGEYRQNEISGGVTGIELKDGGEAFIAGNTVEDARSRGIVIGAGTSPTVEGNRFCGSMVNVLLEEGAAPVFGENEVCPGRAMGD